MQYEDRAKTAARQYQIARFAPNACKQFRKDRQLSQSGLARMLGVFAPTISALENGKIRNWTVAESALILNGEDLRLLDIEETPGLRDLLDLSFARNLPINVVYGVEQTA